MNSSAVSPNVALPGIKRSDHGLFLSRDRRSIVFGGQCCWIKNRLIDLLDRMTKKRAKKKNVGNFFPIATLTGIFQQITPKKKVGNFLAKLSAFHCHRSEPRNIDDFLSHNGLDYFRAPAIPVKEIINSAKYSHNSWSDVFDLFIK